MNTPNPLVPQGTTPAGGKSTVRNAVLTIVVVHVAFIGSLLFWGCSKDSSTKPKDDQSMTSMTNTDPVYPVNTNDATAATAATPTAPGGAPLVPNGSVSTLASTTSSPAIAPISPLSSNVAATPAVITPANPTPVSALTPAAPPVTSPESEYTVAKGDTLAVIAKNKHISVKALEAANPGVDPKKLKVGQKLQIPATVAAAPSATGTPGTAAVAGSESASDSAVYTVKAGDNLARIAKNHHTSIKAIVALNGLKSQNSLKVGQKLKIPAAKAAAAAPAEASTSASAAGAAPAVTPLTSAPHGTAAN